MSPTSYSWVFVFETNKPDFCPLVIDRAGDRHRILAEIENSDFAGRLIIGLDLHPIIGDGYFSSFCEAPIPGQNVPLVRSYCQLNGIDLYVPGGIEYL